jgi:hypothetical protein
MHRALGRNPQDGPRPPQRSVALNGGAATLGVSRASIRKGIWDSASCGAYSEAPQLAQQSGGSGDKHSALDFARISVATSGGHCTTLMS